MGCDGPELPDNNPQEITEPPRNDIDDTELDDSDDERIHFGYELLPQDPETIRDDNDQDSEDERMHQATVQGALNDRYQSTEATNGFESENSPATNTDTLEQASSSTGFDVPPIEPMARVLMREVWNAPRHEDPIEMTADRVDQIRSVMANFTLPFQSEPTWGQAVSNQMLDQWIRNRLDRTSNKTN